MSRMGLPAFAYQDRSERGKLRFTGPQRAWFLHQITTQAFEDIQVGEARDATMITPHGRMVGIFQALAVEAAIYVHFDEALRSELPDAIAKYVLATQVEIEDVTDEMGLVLVVGDPDAIERSVPSDTYVHPTRDAGDSAAYVWSARSAVPATLLSLAQHGGREVEPDELERARIEHAIPRWGRDMDHSTIPLEVGLETAAIHFDKGCYVGQEAIAKIHLRGKVNRRLRLIRTEQPVSPGSAVAKDGSEVGRVTSASAGVALALLKHTVELGDEVAIGDIVGSVAT